MYKKNTKFAFLSLIVFFSAGFAMERKTPSYEYELKTANTIHYHKDQHIHSERFINVRTGRNAQAGFFANYKEATSEGVYDAVKSIPQLTTSQLVLLAIKNIVSYASGDHTAQFNKCTSLLSLAITSKNIQNKEGYRIALNHYRTEMEKIKKLSHEQLMILATHIEGLRNASEKTLANWQEKNFNKLLNKEKVENYKNFSETQIAKKSRSKNNSQDLLKKLRKNKYKNLKTPGKSSILLKKRREND